MKGIEKQLKQLTEVVAQKADKKELAETHVELLRVAEALGKQQETVKSLVNSTKEHKDELTRLRSKLELLETKIMHLSRQLGDLSARVDKAPPKETTKKPAPQQQPILGAIILEHEWEEAKKAIAQLQSDVLDINAQLRRFADFNKRLLGVEELMPIKLDKEEFEKWKLTADMGHILAGLTRKYADRLDTIKSLQRLEKRLLELEERTGKEAMDEDTQNAILAKKRLGGWSCASCQKLLTNIGGVRAPYQPWRKLPNHDLPEHIAKVWA